MAHVESGACDSCKGKENAKENVYRFVAQKAPSFLSRDAIEYQGNISSRPEFPFKCPQCTKEFREMNHMMRHVEDKHPQSRRRQNNFLLALN